MARTQTLLPSLKRKARRQKWLPLLLRFLDQLRIQSKEVESIDDDRGGSKLALWLSQQMFLETLCDGLEDGIHEFYYLKSRQLGITTIGLAIVLFWLAVHPRIIGCIVADSDENSAGFRETLNKIMESFPEDYVGEDFVVERSNKHFMAFSNGSRLDFLVAGKSKTNWAESKGYTLAWVSEVAKYGRQEGLDSFKETLAQTHPSRLFIFESTANGVGNPWHSMWLAAGKDEYTKRRCFVGWWSKPSNTISRKDHRFTVYGIEPNGEEAELIRQVEEQYGHVVTIEQLAWYRWRSADESLADGSLEQNQPWTESQAFVMSGFSFFQIRKLQALANDILENPLPFKGYRFILGNTMFETRMEQIRDQDQLDLVELRVWEEPHADAVYAIGCDPAYGRSEWADLHCLDDQTEILTLHGWKRYDQIKIGDLVSCFHVDNGKYVWGNIENVIVRDHDGPMYHFTNDGLDCLVTPEHRMVSTYYDCRNHRWHEWQVRTAEETASSAERLKRQVPIGGAPIGEGIPNLSLDMCRVLGWIITDGYCAPTSRIPDDQRIYWGRRIRHRITLTQSRKTRKGGFVIADEIDKVLSRLCEFRKADTMSGSINWIIGAKESEVFTAWLDPDDIHKIPRRLIEQSSRDQAEALFQGLLEGDGGWNKRTDKYYKFCPGHSTVLADGFQELALRLGYSATRAVQKGGIKNGKPTKEQWLVLLSTRQSHSIRREPRPPVHYKGTVWCVSVPTGAFVARRNGKAFVTGNCISVWRCFADKIVQVAEYATAGSSIDPIETHHCAWVLAYLAGAYRNCVLNPELNGPGKIILRELENCRQQMNSDMYGRRVHDLEWDDFLDMARWYLYNRYDSYRATTAKGFDTTWRSKQEVLNQLRDMFSTDMMVIRSLPMIEEMTMIVQSRDDIAPQAPGRHKDDRTYATALANRAWIDQLRPQLMQEGASYESVLANESGEMTWQQGFVKKLVYDFWRTAEERSQEEQSPSWLDDRGLV